MALRYTKCFRGIILSLFSSILLVLSFPNFDLGFLAWIGLVPLLIAVNGKSLKYGFVLSLVCGMIFFLGIFYWILVVKGYTALHHALLALYLGSYFALFGLGFCFISKRLGTITALFAAPFLWVSLEYVRGNLSFLAHPWELLAHSQHQYPIVIQISSVTGAYGISFLIVLVNAALTALVLAVKYHLKIPPTLPLPKGGEEVKPLPMVGEIFEPLPKGGEEMKPLLKAGEEVEPLQKGGVTTLQKRGEKHPPLTKGDRGGFVYHFPLLVTAASLLLFTFVYGYFTTITPITGNKVKISLVQGNIEQKKKWNPRFAREIMQIFSELTNEVSKDKPALIIWPETATPGSVTQNPMLSAEIKNIAKNVEAYLLLGSAQHQKFAPKGETKLKYFNSAYLINPDPNVMKNQRYDKICLFPFGEYLPYKEIIPWSLIKVSSLDSYTPGKEFTVFEHPDFRFGVTICWENVFPDLVRRFVKRGAQCIVNLTNEARFEKTAAPHQLVSMSVFRAVENRIYMVRCANTGVSCIIDPHGRIADRIKDEKGEDIFVRGVMSGWIIPLDSKTIYTRYGDWLAWVAVIGSAVFLVFASLKTRKK